MLFFNILLIIYCVYTAALSSGTQRSAQPCINALEATHQIAVSVFLLFFKLGRKEVCSINTNGHNGDIKD